MPDLALKIPSDRFHVAALGSSNALCGLLKRKLERIAHTSRTTGNMDRVSAVIVSEGFEQRRRRRSNYGYVVWDRAISQQIRHRLPVAAADQVIWDLWWTK
jgi:hypothetical protein